MVNSVPAVVRRLVFLLFVGAAALIAPQVCLACSCALLSTEEKVGLAPTVFTGTVVQREVLDDGDVGGGMIDSGAIRLGFVVEVDEVFKGEVTQQTVVYSQGDSAACGIDFTVGEKAIFFISSDSTDEVNLCGGSGPVGSLDSEVALGEGYAPLPGSVDLPGSSADAGDSSDGATVGTAGWAGFGALGVLALALFAWIWWPRRVPR